MAEPYELLRLLTFRPAADEATLDALLRREALPAIDTLPGCTVALAGRRRSGGESERLVVTAWQSPAAMECALDSGSCAIERLLGEQAALATPGTDDVLRVVLARRLYGPPPQIVRVFRGTVREGELAAWEREASRSMPPVVDDERCRLLLLGTRPPNEFAVVTAWSDWAGIVDATGGDPQRQPVRGTPAAATGRAVHYEWLAGLDASGPLPRPPEP